MISKLSNLGLPQKEATPVPSPARGRGLGRGRAINNAKALRTNQTEAEQRLWYYLRAHRLMGLKFKRQKPMGRYIVDFVREEHRLIVEIDGGQHAVQATYDQQRDAWLRSEGYTVLRFWNNDVMQQLDGVLEQIRNVLALSPTPLPQVGEGSEVRELQEASPHKSPLPLAGEGRERELNHE